MLIKEHTFGNKVFFAPFLILYGVFAWYRKWDFLIFHGEGSEKLDLVCPFERL